MIHAFAGALPSKSWQPAARVSIIHRARPSVCATRTASQGLAPGWAGWWPVPQ